MEYCNIQPQLLRYPVLSLLSPRTIVPVHPGCNKLSAVHVHKCSGVSSSWRLLSWYGMAPAERPTSFAMSWCGVLSGSSTECPVLVPCVWPCSDGAVAVSQNLNFPVERCVVYYWSDELLVNLEMKSLNWCGVFNDYLLNLYVYFFTIRIYLTLTYFTISRIKLIVD